MWLKLNVNYKQLYKGCHYVCLKQFCRLEQLKFTAQFGEYNKC